MRGTSGATLVQVRGFGPVSHVLRAFHGLLQAAAQPGAVYLHRRKVDGLLELYGMLRKGVGSNSFNERVRGPTPHSGMHHVNEERAQHAAATHGVHGVVGDQSGRVRGAVEEAKVQGVVDGTLKAAKSIIGCAPGSASNCHDDRAPL